MGSVASPLTLAPAARNELLGELAKLVSPALGAHGAGTAHSVLSAASVLAPDSDELAESLQEVAGLQVDGLLGTLLREVLFAAIAPDQLDNVDEIRFPRGMGAVPFSHVPARLAEVVARIDEFERLWSELDPESASLLV